MSSSLAELVTQRRTALGYTVRSLAARVGVSAAYITHVEHGRIVTLSPPVLSALARELRVSEETLLRASNYSPPRMDPDDLVIPTKSLALLVKQAREALRLTQAQVDEAIGMSTGYTGMIESGRITRPRQETLRKLELVLRIRGKDRLVVVDESGMSSDDAMVLSQRKAAILEPQQRSVTIPEPQQRSVTVPEPQQLDRWSQLPESLRSVVLVVVGFLIGWLIRGRRPRTASFDRTPPKL